MNSASKDFAHHLRELRERLMHPTDYELAVNYFLEEFAGDEAFVKASDKETMPHLVAVLGKVASKAVGEDVELEGVLVSYLRAHKFVHGNARTGDRVVIFFYFEEINAGLLMLIPGIHGAMEVGRFRMPGGLSNPSRN